MKNTAIKITRQRAIEIFVDESCTLVEKLENDRVGRHIQRNFSKGAAADEAREWYSAVATERAADEEDEGQGIVTESETRDAAWLSISTWKDRVDEAFECGRLSE